MKKITQEQIVASESARNKKERRRLRKRKAFKKALKNDKNRIYIRSPRTLCIYRKKVYENTIKFIKSFARTALKEKKAIILDFSGLNDITAAAALCVYAEICRCKLLNKKIGIRMRKPVDKDTRERLENYGFFDYECLMDGNDKKPESFDGNIIPCLSGVHADKKLDDLLDLIEKVLYKGGIEDVVEHALYRSISEALLNVSQHAYTDKSRDEELDKLGKRWWVMGERVDKQLYIVIYDRGVGIPETLPKKYPMEHIYEILSKISIKTINDANMIYAAMELGRTRTGKRERGKGLQDVRKFVEINPNGVLRVYSNKGEYSYRVHEDMHSRASHSNSIKGTLIQWNVQIP